MGKILNIENNWTVAEGRLPGMLAAVRLYLALGQTQGVVTSGRWQAQWQKSGTGFEMLPPIREGEEYSDYLPSNPPANSKDNG